MHYCLADYVLDIVQNAIEAGPTTVRLVVAEDGGGTRVEVEDDGRGMTEAEQRRALDPFWTDGTKHAGRRVGLGLPFLVQALEQTGGTFSLRSEKGRGSTVCFRFPAESVDTPPLGDLPSLFLSALCFPGDHELLVERRKAGGEGYSLKRSELSEALGGLEAAASLALLRDYLASQENDTEDSEQ